MKMHRSRLDIGLTLIGLTAVLALAGDITPVYAHDCGAGRVLDCQNTAWIVALLLLLAAILIAIATIWLSGGLAATGLGVAARAALAAAARAAATALTRLATRLLANTFIRAVGTGLANAGNGAVGWLGVGASVAQQLALHFPRVAALIIRYAGQARAGAAGTALGIGSSLTGKGLGKWLRTTAESVPEAQVDTGTGGEGAPGDQTGTGTEDEGVPEDERNVETQTHDPITEDDSPSEDRRDGG